MFYSLTGDVVYKDSSVVALSCGGVAFRLTVTQNTLNDIMTEKGRITLYTYLSVREDALDLFGFYDESELDCFKLLISVTGVGPKAAIAILSEMTADKLALAVASGDSKAITKAPGIGPKLAQRIVLELKDKLKGSFGQSADMQTASAVAAVSESKNASEAIEALVMLGYTQTEASVAVSKLDKNQSVEKLITQALKII